MNTVNLWQSNHSRVMLASGLGESTFLHRVTLALHTIPSAIITP